MSRSETSQLARSTTGWLLLLLCASLLAWRVDFRIAQFQRSSAGAPVAAVAPFFDANERNLTSIDSTHAQPVRAAQTHPAVCAFVWPPAPPLLPLKNRRGQETSPLLPDIPLPSVSLFANPPPSLG